MCCCLLLCPPPSLPLAGLRLGPRSSGCPAFCHLHDVAEYVICVLTPFYLPYRNSVLHPSQQSCLSKAALFECLHCAGEVDCGTHGLVCRRLPAAHLHGSKTGRAVANHCGSHAPTDIWVSPKQSLATSTKSFSDLTPGGSGRGRFTTTEASLRVSGSPVRTNLQVGIQHDCMSTASCMSA